MIRKATQADYNRLVRSIQTVTKHSPYITTKQLKEDIEQGTCYLKEEKGKFVAVCSLVYDEKYKMFYCKRLSIPNKKNRGKGYAKEMISFFQSLVPESLAATPWRENATMQKMLENLKFSFQYTFQEEYLLYVYKKN